MYVMDSSAIIELAHKTEKGTAIIKILNHEEIAITPFNIYEVYYGVKERERLVIESLLLRAEILDFDRASAMESVIVQKMLERKGKMLGIIDLFIASICKSSGATLITLDKDFSGIEGLKVKVF